MDDDLTLMGKTQAHTHAWRKRNPQRWADIQRRNQLKRKFGITPEDYTALLEGQGGRCAICGRTDEPTKGRSNFSVDEDHATGEIRGLLCKQCNAGLGAFGDDPELMEKAIAYLVRIPRTGRFVPRRQ